MISIILPIFFNSFLFSFSLSKILIIPVQFQHKVYDPAVSSSIFQNSSIALLTLDKNQQQQLPTAQQKSNGENKFILPVSSFAASSSSFTRSEHANRLPAEAGDNGLFLPPQSPRTTFNSNDQCQPVKIYYVIRHLGSK